MRALLTLDFYIKNIHWIGVISVLISVIAWITDFTGLVYVCPYCRVQRTVIGLLGLFLLIKPLRCWLTVYIASVLAFLGAHVAAAQNFKGWIRINKGEFSFYDPVYLDSFLLSACALFIIIGQFWLLLLAVLRQRLE